MTSDLVSELSLASGLPRLHDSAWRSLQRLFAAPAVPVSAGGLQGRLRFDFHACRPDAVERHALYRFRLGAHSGTFGIDSPGLVALCQEPRPEMLPAELRVIALAEALQPVAHGLQTALRLRFEWLAAGEAPPAGGHHAAPWRVESDAGQALACGFVAFDDPAAFDALVPAAFTAPRRNDIPPALRELRVPLRFEIGRTSMRWQELQAVTPGDIVGIEGWRPVRDGLQVHARLGGLALTAVASDHHITLHSIGDGSMTPSLDTARGDEQDRLPLDRLDALEVTLRFELAPQTLPFGALRALQPGHVFDLQEPLNRGTVRLVANGSVIGKGHLVAVGDRLGVRVAEFAAGAL